MAPGISPCEGPAPLQSLHPMRGQCPSNASPQGIRAQTPSAGSTSFPLCTRTAGAATETHGGSQEASTTRPSSASREKPQTSPGPAGTLHQAASCLPQDTATPRPAAGVPCAEDATPNKAGGSGWPPALPPSTVPAVPTQSQARSPHIHSLPVPHLDSPREHLTLRARAGFLWRAADPVS